MPKSMSGILFLASMLLIQLQASTLTLGALSGIAFASNETLQVAILAGVQAAALAAAALLSSRLSGDGDRPKDIVNFLLLGAVSSTVVAVSQYGTVLWYGSIFSRLFLGYIPAARMVALASRRIAQSAAMTSKHLQIIQSVASLAGLAAGPIVFPRLGIATCYCIDAIVLFISVLLYLASHKLKRSDGSKAKAATPGPVSRLRLSAITSVLVLTAPMWVALGVVNIIEAPFLIRYFRATPEFISMVFFTTSLAALAATLVIPASWIAKDAAHLLAVSAIVMISLGVALIECRSTAVLFVISVLIGVANAVFNLSGQNIVQARTDLTQRALGFLGLRLSLPIGMIAACLFMYAAAFDPASPKSFIILSATSAGVIVLLRTVAFARRRAHSMLSTLVFFAVGAFAFTADLECLSASPAKLANFELRLPLREIPSNLDPAVVIDASAALVEHQIFQGLYDYNDANSLSPVLAKSHVISPDGRTFTITVDKSKIFSDGSPVSAAIVRQSLIESLVRLGNKAQWAFGDLDGFSKFITTHDANDLSGLVVKDESTLVFKLGAPFSQFLQVLTSPNFLISHRQRGLLAGTGPYEVESSNQKSIVLRRRKMASTERSPDRIVFVRSPDLQTTTQLARENLIDFFQVPMGNEWDMPGFHRKNFNFLQVVILVMNVQSERFKDPASRCEFAKTVKYEMMKSGNGWLSASKGLPYGWEFFDNSSFPPGLCSKQKSKVLYTNSAAIFSESQLGLVEQGLADRGCNIVFEKRPVKSMFNDLENGHFDAAMVGFIPDYLDPDALLYPTLRSGQLYNWSRYSNQTVDTLLSLNRQMTEANSRSVVMRTIVDRMEADCPISILGSQPGAIFFADRIMEPKVNGLGFHMLSLERFRLKDK